MQKQVIYLIPGDILHWDKEFNRTFPDTFDIVLYVKKYISYVYVIVLYHDVNQTYFMNTYDFQIDRFLDVL